MILGTMWAILCWTGGDMALHGAEHSPAAENRSEAVQRLKWKFPPDAVPGSYVDYIKAHPLRRGSFRKVFPLPAGKMAVATTLNQAPKVSILVEDGLYPLIEESLAGYINEAQARQYAVYLAVADGGTPEDIKSWIRGRYLAGARGIILIGDIAAAWMTVAGEEFPCDLFYMDLDGYWADLNNDGVYDTHTAGAGDEAPELYVARLNTHALLYGNEADMLNHYFNKVKAYRRGELSLPWRGLEYVEEDWYNMAINLDLVFGPRVARYDNGYLTTAQDYLAKLGLGQYLVQVCAHSYSSGHHFSTRPTQSAVYAHVYVHSPQQRQVRMRVGSDDGIKVWLNGEVVMSHDVYMVWPETWEPDEYEQTIQLPAGWNSLLCKISQESGSFRFSVGFRDLAGALIPDLKYHLNNPDIHPPEAGFIRSWLVNGFHHDNPTCFWSYLTTNFLGVDEASINPEPGMVTGGITWTIHDSGAPYVDLDALFGRTDFGASHAFARIYSPVDVACQLWLGYDDGARVWLNGKEILYDNRFGGYTADTVKLEVMLKGGENRLLVKVSEWQDEHGFSARFCYPDGRPVENLAYDPVPFPVSHVGTWLLNGPYYNSDISTRLERSYLPGEASLRPSEWEEQSRHVWRRGIGNGCPFDLGQFFDHGEYITSLDIQEHDPAVHFYNLFACGPGRFTDQNYLAGAYIFNTTYGLVTIASSKTGSMLNFEDFYEPLAQGRSFGPAFLEWFTRQAPYEGWERDWYYGLVLCGDPLLTLVNTGDLDGNGCVDDIDLGLLMVFYGHGAAGDLDGDGDTDYSDLGILMSRWGNNCEPLTHRR
ncbi:MAG: hypothetical protein JXQ27_10205 [Acidobacteria bacterium]|nr:hypothetical protein [Acidobacteriota bacterium]